MPPRRVQGNTATKAEPEIIVGIDLGTTNTSISFLQRKKPEDIRAITNYPEDPLPASYSRSATQVPTMLRYTQSSSEQDIAVTKIQWGYEVSKAGISSIGNQPTENASQIISRPKLLFDRGDLTAQFRLEELGPRIQALLELGVIHRKQDIVSNFFEKILQHAQEQLKIDDILKDDSEIELVLCVPPQWASRACIAMHTALLRAALRTNFGTVDRNRIQHFYMVTEPEAAARYVLAKNHIMVSAPF